MRAPVQLRPTPAGEKSPGFYCLIRLHMLDAAFALVWLCVSRPPRRISRDVKIFPWAR